MTVKQIKDAFNEFTTDGLAVLLLLIGNIAIEKQFESKPLFFQSTPHEAFLSLVVEQVIDEGYVRNQQKSIANVNDSPPYLAIGIDVNI
ncbi:hypothetical protein L1887_36052 [Cichorium endivia]|nr:hypothetical protein L1887_36052 [Cichorium endivia]